jgi:hypothetical protein
LVRLKLQHCNAGVAMEVDLHAVAMTPMADSSSQLNATRSSDAKLPVQMDAQTQRDR